MIFAASMRPRIERRPVPYCHGARPSQVTPAAKRLAGANYGDKDRRERDRTEGARPLRVSRAAHPAATRGSAAEPQEVAPDPMVTRPVLLPPRAFGFVNFARAKQAELPALLWSQAPARRAQLPQLATEWRYARRPRRWHALQRPSTTDRVSVRFYLIIVADALIRRWHVPAGLHPSV